MWKMESVMYFKDITEGGFCQEKFEHMFELADEWYRRQIKTGFCGKEACDVLSVEYYFLQC